MFRVLFVLLLLTLTLELAGCTGSLRLGSADQVETGNKVG